MERRDFFISYTQRDKERAVWIARVLQDNGYTVYMQEMDIFPGDSFLTKMNYFLENSENFIAVWSKPYNDSYYGMMELEAAVTAKMRIIFCCVDNHPVLKLYKRLVHVDLSDMGAASEATLADAVRRAVPRPVQEPETPPDSPPPKPETSPDSPPLTLKKPTSRNSSKPVGGKSSKVWLYLIGFCLAVALVFAGAYGVRTLWDIAVTQDSTGEKLYQTGNDYYFGKNGVDKNYAKAREYYEQAAAKGNAYALYSLGYLYYKGLGVDTDYAKAWEYYEQAEEKGNAAALINLGWMYEHGQGVDIDYEKAQDYYQKAADAGYEIAPAKVEEMREKLNAQSGE